MNISSINKLSAEEIRNRIGALTPAQRMRLEERLKIDSENHGPIITSDTTQKFLKDRYEPFPLTDIQQAYWVGRNNDLALGNFGTHFYFEVDSIDMDILKLESSWNQLIKRHDMLRAIILDDGTQKVLENVPHYVISQEDISASEPDLIQNKLNSIRKEMSHQVLDVSNWPIFQLKITKIDDQTSRIHASFDAIVFDFASRQLLLKEWGDLYGNNQSAFEELGITFRDIVLNERAIRNTDTYQKDKNYWLSRIDNLPKHPELPLSSKISKELNFTRRTGVLDKGLWKSLKQYSSKQGITPSSLLLSIYADILRIWSTSLKFTLNLTLFNRPYEHANINKILGDFSSLTMLEVDATQNNSFVIRANKLQKQLWKDIDHRYFSGIEVVREIARRSNNLSSANMPVVFTSALVQDANSTTDLSWLGNVAYSISQTPQVWIDLIVEELGGELLYHWNSIDGLFPENLMQNMFEAYGAHLNHLATDKFYWEQEWLITVKKIIPENILNIQREANNTTTQIADQLLHESWKYYAIQTPNKVAITSASDSITYLELQNAITKLATDLRALGAIPNELIAIVMEKGWEQVVAALSILESGAAFLPIDPDVPAERLAYLLNEGAVSIVITQSSLKSELSWPDTLKIIEVSSFNTSETLPPLPHVNKSSDLAYVIFTSGSTGKPKGVAIDHKGAVNTINDINNRFNVNTEDSILALSALSFDLSIYDIFGLLAVGGTIVIPKSQHGRDPARWAELIFSENITIWNSVPALMDILVEYLIDKDNTDLKSLRLALLSGDKIAVNLPEKVKILAPDLQLISLGGATEASIWSIFYPIKKVDPEWVSIPYGKPLGNQTFHVIKNDGTPCPTWVAGELYIGGIGLAKKYWNDVEKTDYHFINNQIIGNRLYRTGDIGRYLPDGNIEFLGRNDNQVKINGFRIELGEVESALCSIKGIKNAVVVATGKDSNDRKLVGFYVPEEQDASLYPEKVRTLLQESLPTYLIPTSLVALPEIRISKNGKIDRQHLIALAQSQRISSPSALSSNELEIQIRDLIRTKLEIDIPNPESSFLELGLTSVDVIRIINAAERAFNFRPQIESIYKNPTIRALASVISKNKQLNTENYSNEKIDAVWTSSKLITDPQDQKDFKNNLQDIRIPQNAYRVISLQENDHEEDILQSFRERKSSRQFSIRMLSKYEFSRLLKSISHSSGNSDQSNTYGSPGGLYPVQVYIYVKPQKIEDIESGVYFLDSTNNTLRQIDSSQSIDRSVYNYLINAPIYDESAFALFLVSEMQIISPIYGDKSLHLATIEAGLITQNLEIFAPKFNISVCQIGSINQATVRKSLALRDSQVIVHSLLGGAKLDSSLNLLQSSNENTIRKYPLSYSQQRLWFLDQYETERSVYNIPFAIRLIGEINYQLLEDTINNIVLRHESLRTFFSNENGIPYQNVLKDLKLNLAIQEIILSDRSKYQIEVSSQLEREAIKGFDLNTGPLIRATMLRVTPSEHILMLTLHHAIADGWSLSVLIKEISDLYELKISKKENQLPPLQLQYKDYTIWQRSDLQTSLHNEQLNYWRKILENAPSLINLPLDRPRPANETYKGALTRFDISSDLLNKLKKLSKELDVTLFTLLGSVFSILLNRYTNQNDLVFGTVVAGRNRAELEDLIGLFVNTLALRVSIDQNQTFTETLQKFQRIVLGALSNQDVPFDKLVEELNPERSLSYAPICQVAFILRNAPQNYFHFPGIESEQLPTHTQAARFDLTFSLWEENANLKGIVEYKTSLFDQSTILRIVENFQVLLRGVIDNQEAKIHQLPVIAEAERYRLLTKWNSYLPINKPTNLIHQLFEEQVEKTPDAIAVIFNNQKITYKELNLKANKVAHMLKDLGLQDGDIVGVCVERSIEMVVALYAVLKAGGAFLPIDPRHPLDRVRFILNDTSSKYVLTQSKFEENFSTQSTKIVILDSDFSRYSEKNLDNLANLSQLMYVIYTSGSTGLPKGVLIEHSSVKSFFEAISKNILVDESSSWLAITPITFDISVLELFLPLAKGARVVIAETTDVVESDHLARLVNAHKVNILQATPSIWQLIKSNNTKIHLDTALTGGEALDMQLSEYLQVIADSAWNLYGPTEATIWATACKLEKGMPVSIGRPLLNTHIYILDDYLSPVPIGVVGEIYIGGHGVASGYLNREELTKEKFIGNKYNPSLGLMYKTGDLGRYLVDGNIEFLGRIDYQVKIRGARVELGEVENSLLTHPAVRQAVIVPSLDGQNSKQLVAYLVFKNNNVIPTIEQLREHLLRSLPEYMVPNAWMTLESMPMSSNGKVDRSTLPELAKSILYSTQNVEPNNEMEKIVLSIWSELLKTNTIGVNDNFFSLGGHSLIATQLIARLAKFVSRDIKIRDVYKYPTIAEFANFLLASNNSTNKTNPEIIPRVSRNRSIVRQ